MLRPDEWVVVRNCGYLHEAHVVAAVLDASGIDAFIPDSHMAGLRPELTNFLGGVRVLVPAPQLELAEEALTPAPEAELPGRGMLMGDADWE